MSGFGTPTHLRRDRLSDRIAKDIEERVLSGELTVGDRLPSERDLMAHYGVGRPAVREALLWLSKTGMLSVSNGDRTRVTEPDPRDLLQLLSGAARMLVARPEGIRQFQHTRIFVEVALVREAVRLATDKDVADLEALLLKNESCTDDILGFSATDDAFHHRIGSIAQDPLLDALYHVVLELLEEQRRFSLSHPDGLRKAMAAHRHIFEAIRDRDADRAEAAMREHLATVIQTYWDIREQTPDTP
ncbi:FCD domain-containing protein [Ancylobacter dichloromethanicus]|uniref:GntR family transcriptional regulator n=1 Tax=Ancylobacter dichloromethanicus TaxID=518825 RepID=A0A9W6MZ00_9HYPH|nr:FCD domain-containing protein [Ancylobacter dichloromethanicus]MBS7552810.1 FCD domain-containing protein [Ancylobacter dichloromethanicus]GLK72174.1 GntR family transcriptional regulator [Ancylobacter dichloromethanicus]